MITQNEETYFWTTDEGWFVGTDSTAIGPFLSFAECIYRWQRWQDSKLRVVK